MTGVDEFCQELTGAGLASLFVGRSPSLFPERHAPEGFASRQGSAASVSKHTPQFCGRGVLLCC